jgi:PGF-CTERM protein/uncharacterized repeat protein (TIGR01451 family)
MRWGTILAAAMLLAVLATAPVTAQSDAAGLSVTAGEATPGETVTLTFEFANTGDEPTATVVSVSELPEDWTVQSRADDGGVWREDRSWLFRRVEAGGSVAPSVTVAVPADASGSVTVAGNATVGDRTVTDQTTVNVAESGGTATENATSETGTSDGSGPGFGVGIALAAALGLALVIGRSQ